MPVMLDHLIGIGRHATADRICPCLRPPLVNPSYHAKGVGCARLRPWALPQRVSVLVMPAVTAFGSGGASLNRDVSASRYAIRSAASLSDTRRNGICTPGYFAASASATGSCCARIFAGSLIKLDSQA